MEDVIVCIDGVSKRFSRSWALSLRYALWDGLRRACRLPGPVVLRKHEFWALDQVEVFLRRSECLAVIGPNGAGKTTLLKLIARDYRPDRGRVLSRGRVRSLMRLGEGLQPLLSGRENIQLKCAELGLSKRETDAKLGRIIEFADLKDAIDRPVKHYSDGMHARLDFAIAAHTPADVLLIDETLAVSDIAFQLRCLDRLNTLKQEGTAVVLVSHSDTNIRHVADRCVLLVNGKLVAQGDPDAVLLKYHEAVGYLNRALRPLGVSASAPEDFTGAAVITRFGPDPQDQRDSNRHEPGGSIEWQLDYRAPVLDAGSALVLQFWNSADLLVASVDSRYCRNFRLKPGTHTLRVSFPFLALTPGSYRVAGGFVSGARFLGYRRSLANLQVSDSDYAMYAGLALIPAEICFTDDSGA
jgi:ABC-type polysaccharide/polyol phosphate transport system ATPase subunit